MKTIVRLSAIIFATTFLFSCSVQKRRYSKGWHVEWANAKACPHKTIAPIEPVVVTPIIEKKEQASTVRTEKTTESSRIPAREQSGRRAVRPAQKENTFRATANNDHRPLPNIFKKLDIGPNTPSDNTDDLALMSLIFGIASFFVIFCFIPAIIIGRKALKNFDAGRGSADNRFMAEVGLVLGWVAFGIFIFVLIIFLVIISLFSMI